MAERLDSTVALATGASSGIGEATAVALVAQGAQVAMAGRIARANSGGYNTTKFGMVAFSKSLRQEASGPRRMAIDELLIRLSEQER